MMVCIQDLFIRPEKINHENLTIRFVNVNPDIHKTNQDTLLFIDSIRNILYRIEKESEI